MPMRRWSLFERRPGALIPLLFSVGLVLAFIQPGCSNSSSSSDGSGEGGSGGAGGLSTGGASGESGHPGTGGASGGVGGAGGKEEGGTSGGGAGGAAGKGAGGAAGSGAGGASGGAGKGTGGAGGNQTFSCGSDTCTAGQSFCYTYTPGTAGSTGRSCQTIPSACASSPTSCACVCPPSTSPGLGCVPVGLSMGAYCSCSDTGGLVDVTCAGA